MVKYDICMNCGTYHSYMCYVPEGKKRCMICNKIADHITITYKEFEARFKAGKKGKYAKHPFR